MRSNVLKRPDPWPRFCVNVRRTWVTEKLTLYLKWLASITKWSTDSPVPHVEWKAPNITVLHFHIQDKFCHFLQGHSLENLQCMAYPVQAYFQCWKNSNFEHKWKERRKESGNKSTAPEFTWRDWRVESALPTAETLVWHPLRQQGWFASSVNYRTSHEFQTIQ